MALGDNGPDLGPFESDAAMADPQSNAEVMAGSLVNILHKNRGYFVSCDFLIGTSNIVTKDGILYESGINFLALYNASDESYVVCDLYSLKFVTFYPARTPYLPQAEPALPGGILPPMTPNNPGPTPRGSQQWNASPWQNPSNRSNNTR